MATFAGSRTLKELLEEYEWELPTSFIDVVFLLLLYFTLTMKFHTLEQRMEAYLPNKGPGSDERPPIKPELEIQVATAGPASGAPVFQVGTWTTADPNALAAKMAQLERTCPKYYQVVINGAQGCPFKHVMAALDACARAGITKVDFRPPPAADGSAA
ncbi:MAG TPA: biopolymer transporter ExbD [Planctomycetota bacterium]|nr:biopolymer transporter ExbD [Planctomycetota bacterium]